MHLNIEPTRGILQFDDARLIFKNFRGEAGKFNREGDRSFHVSIKDPEIADALVANGWNVKVKEARDEDDNGRISLQVKVKFNDRGPIVRLQTGNRVNKLTEDTIGILDNIDIERVDLDVRPYDWTMSDGKSGRTAYLQSMHVVQAVDRFADRCPDEFAQ